MALVFAFTGEVVAAPGVTTVAGAEITGADATTGNTARGVSAKPKSVTLATRVASEGGGADNGTNEGLLTRGR